MKTSLRFLLFLCFIHITGTAQITKQAVITNMDAKQDYYSGIAKQLWEEPELSYLEERSATLLQNELNKAGFSIEKGVANIPTAFVASYGSGSPVIAVLGEFDALPGMSQEAVPYQQPRIEGAPGQACGHHLFGAGALAAAIAVKDWLQTTNTSGTIRYYGTPAEEGGSGKVYMVRAGLFNDVDAVLTWHPWNENNSNPSTNLATISGKFRFKGTSAHAAAAPEMGRSALDAVESMNMMVNLLREHTTESTRIHYVITKGGDAPNIVPAEAEVYYVVRHANRDEVKNVWNRIVKAAEGAALGTETTMNYEIIGGTYDKLPNEALAQIMHDNLTLVGGVHYTQNELDFAKAIQKTLSKPEPLDKAEIIQPMAFTYGKASADTADVSWAVPLSQIRTATWVPGTPAHSWQAVAAGGSSIGFKGMMVAAKTLALSAIDLYTSPELLKDIRTEFNQRRGTDYKYEALLGNRQPALDYRK
ncbi:amidohydrolase [Mangrovimonas sp. YM274]|uniref:amidohydrolase n=1 Tax=Mangrovimonas sp. YM274 TaxID=3070660 RepID=UPI0027DABA45|nr:amidohydrolase [Mangrovimonas sp. YM274]WMI67467.1 amidohydrolase [Mangrovimonas sp. YM274]